MGRLRLCIDCVEVALKKWAAAIGHASIGVSHGRAYISVHKIFTGKVEVWSQKTLQARRALLHYSANLPAKAYLFFARSTILRENPFIEKLDGGELIINLDLLARRAELPAWISIDAIQIPAPNNDYCEIEFSIKECETCPS